MATGGQVVYTATITNHGPAAAPTAAFQDIIPASTNLASANASQGSCSGSPTVVCNLGALGPGAAATVTITVTTTRQGTVFDRGWVSDSPPGNWHRGHLVVTQVRDANRRPRPAPVRIAVERHRGPAGDLHRHGHEPRLGHRRDGGVPGSDPREDRRSSPRRASQGSCSGNPTVLCSLGSLAANASATVTIVVATTQPGPIVDRGWVSTSPPGGWQHERDVTTNVSERRRAAISTCTCPGRRRS